MKLLPTQKLFARHAVHTLLARYVPGIQRHALLLLLAVDGFNVFGRKLAHCFFMPFSQYVFEGHEIHSSWFGDAYFPGSHVTHPLAAVVPVFVVIFPLPHGLQAALFSV